MKTNALDAYISPSATFRSLSRFKIHPPLKSSISNNGAARILLNILSLWESRCAVRHFYCSLAKTSPAAICAGTERNLISRPTSAQTRAVWLSKECAHAWTVRRTTIIADSLCFSDFGLGRFYASIMSARRSRKRRSGFSDGSLGKVPLGFYGAVFIFVGYGVLWEWIPGRWLLFIMPVKFPRVLRTFIRMQCGMRLIGAYNWIFQW